MGYQMIKVLFFARIREQLGTATLDIDLTKEIKSISQLIDNIANKKGRDWKEILTQDNIVTAVNQIVVDGDVELNDGDELAFYPPVTGG